MTYTSDSPLPTEQLTTIRKLLKKHKTLCRTESSKITTEQQKNQRVKANSLLPSEDSEETELHSMGRENMYFSRRVNRTTCIPAEAKKADNQSRDSKIFPDGESDSDSEPSSLCNGIAESHYRNNCKIPFGNSNNDRNRKCVEHSGAQWDVFRRQDVPKLIEYLKKQSDEFSYTHDYHKQVIQQEDNSIGGFLWP